VVGQFVDKEVRWEINKTIVMEIKVEFIAAAIQQGRLE
jgi:hypothetical protein